MKILSRSRGLGICLSERNTKIIKHILGKFVQELNAWVRFLAQLLVIFQVQDDFRCVLQSVDYLNNLLLAQEICSALFVYTKLDKNKQ